MLQVNKFINKIFASNTYLISRKGTNICWFIDIGDIEPAIWCRSEDLLITGVFITHSHFDHIYGINKLIDLYPDCVIYTSDNGKNGLFSEKLNLSYYHEDPFVFMGSNVRIIKDKDKVDLYGNHALEVLETPGHNPGCLTYKIDNYLFTGDSYIPGVQVVTKLKGGNKIESDKSLTMIMDNITETTVICPGHGEMTKGYKNAVCNNCNLV